VRRYLLTIGVVAALVVGVLWILGSVPVVESTQARACATNGVTTYSLDFHKVQPRGPVVRLKCALLVNYDDGSVIFAKNADEVRSIASISKLMSAMVFLDRQPNLDSTVTITQEDAYQSSRSRLRTGYRMTLRNLLYTSLMVSDNRATRALARAVSGSCGEFADLMNAKAQQLGLTSTSFVEPTGLDERNVSTAAEVAKLLYHARSYPLIARITSTANYRVKVLNRKQSFLKPISNTNLLVHSPYDVLAGKTGYIRASQYCLVSVVQNRTGGRLTVVALGAPGAMTRFREARKLVDWGFKQI
jgi:D-alanyl-D-alanine endopeptidase (penicillin-binding protein 7)